MILSSTTPAVTSRAASFGHAVSQKVADHPMLFTADALDIGTGLSNSFSMASGTGGQVLQGAGYVMGAYHGVSAVVNLFAAMDHYSCGRSDDGKYYITNMVGHALTATGNVCAAAGVGPVSLGFLGLGLAVGNLNTLNN